MKKRFMILPPFLVIFMMYGALPDMSAATEGTTGTTETILQVPIFNEPPPGIQLPETVTGGSMSQAHPQQQPRNLRPQKLTAVDEQMTETPLQNSLCRKRPIRNQLPQKQLLLDHAF